jgi:transglutaminase-like putative cysteine protease
VIGLAALRRTRAPVARTAGGPTPALLTPAQIQSLGILLVAAQLPQAVYLPVWIGVIGIGLVVLRFVLVHRRRTIPAAGSSQGTRSAARWGEHIPAWALALIAIVIALLIRQSYGYFVGRDPCVAFLFVLIGIKFLEVRTLRDGTLLVCLAIFLAITPFFYSQSLLAGFAALPAVLAVGAALESLATPHAGTIGLRGVRRAWLRTGTFIAQGLPIAAALFLLFPRLASPLWGLPADHAAATGLSDRMSPGSISEVSLSDAVAFRVDFDGAPPPRRMRYWRGPVLSLFNGREWRAFSPRPGGRLLRGDAPSTRYTVTLEPDDHPWLFALDFPSTLPELDTEGGARGSAGGLAGYSREQQLITRGPITQPLRYTLTSLLVDSYPVATALEAQQNSRTPPGNPRTVDFARSLRARYPDDRRFISAVLQWFHSEPFFYTLSPPLLEEGEPVDMFLFDTRRGFCEHYASAFVVMLRAAGIPARVVTGYQGGEINPRGGYMIVRQSDAHAWAEAVVDGQWQRFDPTAAVAPSRIERGLYGSVPAGDPVPLFAREDGGWLKGLQLTIDAFNHQWQRNVIQFNRDRQRALWREWKLDRFAPWQMVVAVAGGVIAWAFGVLAWFASRRKRRERALTLWDDACRRLARAGLPRQDHEGPLAFAERATRRWPQFEIAFRAIGESFATLRYGNMANRESERLALLATLQRAIEALPRPSTLRAMPSGSAQ